MSQPRWDTGDHEWGALSGLVADRVDPLVLYAVPDDAYASRVLRIRISSQGVPLEVKVAADVSKDGQQAYYDLEGIAHDTSSQAPAEPGFWLASEGNARFDHDDYLPNMIVQVDGRGRVLQEVRLPQTVDSPRGGLVSKYGFEGVTVSSDGRYVVCAIQGAFRDDSDAQGHFTRIARYDLTARTWEFFLYPLDTGRKESTFVGLSELINLGGDRYAVIERDNEEGKRARVKRIYAFRLDGVAPFEGVLRKRSDLSGRVITKTLLADTQPLGDFPKIEGLALAADGALWAGPDDDGRGQGQPFVRVLDRVPTLDHRPPTTDDALA